MARSPILAAFLTDETMHGGSRARTSLGGYPTHTSVGEDVPPAERNRSLVEEAGGSRGERGTMEKSWVDLDAWGMGGFGEDNCEAMRVRNCDSLFEAEDFLRNLS